MEVEKELLGAIDQLAKDGDAAAIRCLAALLACDGNVERRTSGWQHPFQDFAEREGEGLRQSVERLIQRGIVTRSKTAIAINSHVMSRSRAFVTLRCANRLFSGAWAHFAPVLGAIRCDDLRDLTRRQSTTAASRAHRNMGTRYWELKRMGLLVYGNRSNPRLFPTLSYVDELPRVAAVALTLEQGHALTTKNLVNEVGIHYYVAVATGCLAQAGTGNSLTLTDRGRELATTYVADAIRRRLRWIGNCRTETMHFLADQPGAPLPAVWVDGKPSEVRRAWTVVGAEDPLRILFMDRQLRAWLRCLVRRLQAMGLSQSIACRDGIDRYYFAPGVVALAKDELGLPQERFALPPDLSAPFSAYESLLAMDRDDTGRWYLRAGVPGKMRELKSLGLLAGPRDDGTYSVKDLDRHRSAMVEVALGPVCELLTSLPEPDEATPRISEPGYPAPAASL